MTCKELMEYLSCFDQDGEVHILIVDPVKRLRYKICKTFLIEDMPVLVFGTNETEEFDAATDCAASRSGDGNN